jgi:alkylation response protein AidB-like acyl-CoA dehydrogenase
MQPTKKETFGNLGPWAEPSWYSSLASPYYNESHKRLRNVLRAYIDTNVKPYMLEWEEKGEAPVEERMKWAKTGFAFGDVPEPYRPKDVPGPAGIPVGDMDIFHLMVSTDEGSRIEGGVGTALGGGSVIGVPPIVHHGTEEQKRKWLPGLFSWETSFCLGITEPSGGVSPQGTKIDAYRINVHHSLTSQTYKPRRRKLPTENTLWSTDTRNGSQACLGLHI